MAARSTGTDRTTRFLPAGAAGLAQRLTRAAGGLVLAVPRSDAELSAIWVARASRNSHWIGIHDLDGDNVKYSLFDFRVRL